MRPCSENYNILGHKTIFHDYSFWDNEIKFANNVANYLTSMWRYKDGNNRSLIENEEAIYTLTSSIAISSDRIYASAVCFDRNKFQARRQFCPYAFKNSSGDPLIVRDLGRFNDYLTPHYVQMKQDNNTYIKHKFIWWHVGKKYLSNATQLQQNTVYFDKNLDYLATNGLNVSALNGEYFNITSKYIPVSFGKWTTPYYDCFGGITWVISYLVPFFDEADKYL
ncbi:Hypothetical predicted protein [Paramuricea clavata]|uniref:Uncharacterized protein n=1 Tax=Paramuricea clavata TaxID=317549 RepID=A0A6S7J9Q6_PARCT|nr:Hypothetical predicted protein [Paramuricea clavata]